MVFGLQSPKGGRDYISKPLWFEYAKADKDKVSAKPYTICLDKVQAMVYAKADKDKVSAKP